MVSKALSALILFVAASAAVCFAQDSQGAAPQIELGNGEANYIEVEGLTRQAREAAFSELRIDGADVLTRRANSTALSFPEVLIEQAGWLVLHPVVGGRPDGDVVSGFAYLAAGKNEDVTIQTNFPADAGDQFLVMLHSDVDQDRVFDFVFVEDGVNVEDRAVFEGNRMIAHIVTVP